MTRAYESARKQRLALYKTINHLSVCVIKMALITAHLNAGIILVVTV